MTRVLGTPVLPTAAAPARALLLSDLHVPSDGGAVVAMLDAALTAAAQRQASVFVLGDLFDSYVSRWQVRHGIWRDTAARFRRAVEAGVPIALLHGNRDFLLGAEFERDAGVQLVAGGLRGVLGGVDTLLLHGDELCQNDLPYQRAKRWLRRPSVRLLARSLPVWLATRVAERARQKSRTVIASGDQTRFLPTRAAVGEALAIGVQRLVFGHIHRHAHDRIGAQGYWVLPAFDATGVGLWLEGGAAVPVRCDAGGLVEVPVPGPCPLAG
ncbi:MAG: UDP-2,3-diacylglucosamine diphosphatase [Planctomycetes bacterium]|nr:UDP-2,3-diacylglucosamine diphosphatase [Planctomycetota bacterium]